jgi:hypothetical protein
MPEEEVIPSPVLSPCAVFQKSIPKFRHDFFRDFQLPKDECLDPYYALKGTDELR